MLAHAMVICMLLIMHQLTGCQTLLFNGIRKIYVEVRFSHSIVFFLLSYFFYLAFAWLRCTYSLHWLEKKKKKNSRANTIQAIIYRRVYCLYSSVFMIKEYFMVTRCSFITASEKVKRTTTTMTAEVCIPCVCMFSFFFFSQVPQMW